MADQRSKDNPCKWSEKNPASYLSPLSPLSSLTALLLGLSPPPDPPLPHLEFVFLELRELQDVQLLVVAKALEPTIVQWQKGPATMVQRVGICMHADG